MKMFAILGMVIIIFVVLLSSIGDDVNASMTSWEPVATAIAYQQFQLPGPHNAFVARTERDYHDAFLESSIAQGKIASGRETTSGMAARYDDAINYWDEAWGKRNQVVVAINGDYFNWNSGIPLGGQIQSGWYSKRFQDLGGGSGFIWKLDGTAFIGECVLHRPENQFVTYSGWTEPLTIDAVNVERQANHSVRPAMYPQFSINVSCMPFYGVN